MTRRNAAFMTFAAAVSSFVLWRGRRPVHEFTDVPGDNDKFAVNIEISIAFAVLAERPYEAVVAGVEKGNFVGKS
jgi:hypothetical protein